MADTSQDPGSEAEKSRIQETFQDAWMSVLGVYQNAESEVQKATNRVLEAFGVTLSADGEAHHLGNELKARIRKNREEFERKVDEGVRAAVARVRAPIDKEIANLKERVEHLQGRLDAQTRARVEALGLTLS